jgi:ergothioneine biosynthesis protein EgtB
VLDRDAIARRYARVRARTEALAARLSDEDAMVQSMPEASPTKWHLAHTTWFFEEFFLSRQEPGHRWPDDRWRVLFNSYYDAVGARHARAARGVLSRPSLEQVRAWRASVDDRVLAAIAMPTPRADQAALEALLLGTHHEEQHQELVLTDIKHTLWCSELRPAYADDHAEPSRDAPPLVWIAHGEAEVWVGCEGLQRREDGLAFAFDNETPRHRVLVGAHRLASRLVTNAEYAAFVDDGGYARPELWLSDGWAAAQTDGWRAPLYWEGQGTERRVFGMRGMQPLDPHEPVSHVSFYEADAYARWAGGRLPTEFEWERAAQRTPVEGSFLDEGRLAPRAAPGRAGADQLFGDVWEWTASAYLPYPRFRPLAGALGEYNGKFMSGQMVLRGGSCFSSREHMRATYRNFFPPNVRWQMSGIRLARDD